jgi:hypothetical protein
MLKEMLKKLLKIFVEKLGGFSTKISTDFPNFSTSFPQVFHKEKSVFAVLPAS